MQKKILVVGLGNIGDEYVCTRHNVGFHVADKLAYLLGEDFSYKSSLYAYVVQHVKPEGTVLIAKPSQYMNNSGNAVQALCHWYKIPVEQCIVVTDNIDLQTGDLRLKKSGKGKIYCGTHNGIKSVVECLGSNNFMRLYLGIGGFRQKNEDLASYVLRKWPKSQHAIYETMCDIAVAVLENVLSDDFQTMNTVLARLKKQLLAPSPDLKQ